MGQSFTITCNSSGFPELSYTISHNGTHLINAKTYTDNDVVWSDAGEYECNARNERGNDTASEVLKVTGKILIQCLPILSPDENTRGTREEKRISIYVYRGLLRCEDRGRYNYLENISRTWSESMYTRNEK